MRWLLVSALLACGGGSATVAPTTVAPTNRQADAEPAPVREASPFKAAPWIAKLDDPAQRERAVTELEQLGDPAAIDALGRVWVADRELRVLQVVISLARPLTAADAKARLITDYEATGRPANWKRASGILLRAIGEIKTAHHREVDAAIKAADALGEAQLPESVQPLLALAARPADKKTLGAQVAAIRALGRLTFAKAQIGPGLARIIDVEPPPHPRTATTKDGAHTLEMQFSAHLAITGSAINALHELRVTTEAKSLVLAIYRTPELAVQIRRALVSTGPAARDMLLDVLAGKHAAVEQLFKTKKLGRYCGDRNELPDNQCQPVALRDFQAAVVLGDFHDSRAVPALLAVFQRPAAPAYYLDENPGPTQYTAAFDALRKVGSADSAAPLRAMWLDRKLELTARTGAVEAYGFVARDDAGARELGKIAADNGADDNLRTAAAVTLARLSTDKLDIALFLSLGQKYLEASAQKRKEADRRKPAADAADKPLAKGMQHLDQAKDLLVAATKDPAATADRIRTLTQAVRQAEDDYKAAKRKHREATAPFREADQAAKAYVGFARMFQTHVARVAVALRCKADLDCYAGSLKLQPDQAADQVAAYIKDVATWNLDEKTAILEATIERSMLELGKRGQAASAFTESVLVAAGSHDRVIRQSVLYALPKIAKLPCASCVARLDAVVASDGGRVTLNAISLETSIVRDYFRWAGR